MEAGKKKKKKIWLIVLLAALAVIAVAAIMIMVKKFTGEVETAVNTVEVEPVKTRDLSDYISLNGTVSGISRTNVVSQASAEVLNVNVQVGDAVKTGDALISLDTTELEKQIAELEKQIQNADALARNEASQRDKSLAEAKEDQSNAINRAAAAVSEAQGQVEELQGQIRVLDGEIGSKKEAQAQAAALVASLEPQKDLSEEQLAAYQEAVTAHQEITEELAVLEQQRLSCEQSLPAANSAVSAAKDAYEETVTSTGRAVSAAQNTVEMAKYQTDASADLSAQLDLLKEQLADCKLTAPCGGVITAVNVSVGDRYGAGQTMITIEDTSVLKVAVEVKETDILKISEGMKAVIKTNATGEEELSGSVTRVVRVKNQSVNPNAMPGEGAVAGYSAEITIDHAELLIGMTATAKIILQEKKDALAVPYDLIRYDEEENPYVLVAESTGDGQAVAVRRDLTLGEEIDYYVEVSGGSLQAGELLIHDYTGAVTEGSVFIPEEIYQEVQTDVLGKY